MWFWSDLPLAERNNMAFEIVDEKSRMRLACRLEPRFYTQMHLHRSKRKPAPAAFCQHGRLCDFRKAEELAIEASRSRFPAFRHGKLHVVDGDDGHGRPAQR